jgi:hypothetical protein
MASNKEETLISVTNVTIAAGGVYEWELGPTGYDSVTRLNRGQASKE